MGSFIDSWVPRVWVVLPAYNEEQALPLLLKSIHDSFSEQKKTFHVIVVNDGSVDQTASIAERASSEMALTLLHNKPNKGLAETLRRGLVEAAQKADPRDIIVTMDADYSHPVGLVFRMIPLIREGHDVVIASRFREGSRVLGLSLFRRFLSVGASWLFRFVFPTAGVRDFTCGFRAYRAKVIQELVRDLGEDHIVSERGFSCMVDVFLKLRARRTLFTEVPFVLRYDLKPGASKMRVFRTIKETLLLMARRRLGKT